MIKQRVQKELRQLTEEPPSGISVDVASLEDNLSELKMNLHGFENTLYEGETFQLLFQFDENYPFHSPVVKFTGKIPIHPHVYSNGHICLSILTTGWLPSLTIESVCLSIVSMLSSCRVKQRPPNDASYVSRAGENPKLTQWRFDDDTV
uniref:UBC core domain-containing protein n=1 Tax=Stomoxys calcitrans TaxID=35570 RepID=A0A1I8PUW7_STOCA